TSAISKVMNAYLRLYSLRCVTGQPLTRFSSDGINGCAVYANRSTESAQSHACRRFASALVEFTPNGATCKSIQYWIKRHICRSTLDQRCRRALGELPADAERGPAPGGHLWKLIRCSLQFRAASGHCRRRHRQDNDARP